MAFALGLATSGYLTVRADTDTHQASHPPVFNHDYPPDPVSVERPKVHGPPPQVPTRNIVGGHMQADSLAALGEALPKGVLVKTGADRWLLAQPAAVGEGAVVDITAPASLEIAPGAFLEVTRGGALTLRSLTVTAVDSSGRPEATPVVGRGFILALEGGRLWLDHANLVDLGYLSVLSYGISMRAPAPGSGIVDSTIEGNFIGIYTKDAVDVQILRNHVSHSAVYGIDPHSDSSRLSIEDNVVTDSGVHGIVLADRVTASRVIDNVVDGAGDHGVVLIDGSDGNVVQGNRITGTFDGIVVTASSSNDVTGNTIEGAKRFGIRIEGSSKANTVQSDSISDALVGIYVYGGATENRLIDNQFAGDAENVRIREDAPANLVSPIPELSEIAP